MHPILLLQLLNLCVEPCDVLSQVIDGSLLLVRVGRTIERHSPESLFKEMQQRVRPT
jgi:hypothetical protein